MALAPEATPWKPKGIKGVQLEGLTYQTPITMKSTTTASLMTTIKVLNRAVSFTPRVSRKPIRRIINAAGRSK
ncbi:hypothetical protein D3C87_1893500 [compost metagenome]